MFGKNASVKGDVEIKNLVIGTANLGENALFFETVNITNGADIKFKNVRANDEVNESFVFIKTAKSQQKSEILIENCTNLAKNENIFTDFVKSHDTNTTITIKK